MQPQTGVTLMALLLAHLMGDFPFQSHRLAANKGRSAPLMLWHGGVHYLLACLCLSLFAPIAMLSLLNQAIVLFYIAAHIAIDWLKAVAQRRGFSTNATKAFLLDQALHFVAMILAALALTRSSLHALYPSLQLSPSLKVRILATAIVYIAVVFGGGYLIRFMIRGLENGVLDQPAERVENAGLYIGWIERFLIVTAMAMQSPALVGLIFTGKSIARFPEFKDNRFAEYFLIGTLLSISMAVLGGMLLLELWYGSISLSEDLDRFVETAGNPG